MITLSAVFLVQATVLSGCCNVTRAEATQRIGTLDGPLETIFSLVSTIDIGSDGSLYVLETSAAEIRVFSRNGEFVRTIGRRGEGPGELKLPVNLGVRNDSLWVFDAPAQKIELFMIDGRHVSSLSHKSLRNVAPLGWFEDGRFLAQPTVAYGPAMRSERPFFVADLAARRVDTLGVGRIEHGSMKLTGVTASNLSFVGANPLAREDKAYVEPNGRFAVMLNQTTVAGRSNERFELVKVDADGQVIWRRLFELPFAQDVNAVVADIVEETVRTAIRSMSDQIRQNFRERVYRDELRKALLSVGDRAGLVERMLMDREGRIWLQASPVVISPNRSAGDVWYVLGNDGEPLGAVHFPSSMLRLLAVQGNRAFGTTLGEFDELYVTSFAFSLQRGERRSRGVKPVSRRSPPIPPP